MEEDQIKKLLHQASFTHTSRDEYNGILDKLLAAVPVDKSRKQSKAHLKRDLIEEVFWATQTRDPADFPAMLPVFAILCRTVEVATNRKPPKPKKWERNRDAS